MESWETPKGPTGSLPTPEFLWRVPCCPRPCGYSISGVVAKLISEKVQSGIWRVLSCPEWTRPCFAGQAALAPVSLQESLEEPLSILPLCHHLLCQALKVGSVPTCGALRTAAVGEMQPPLWRRPQGGWWRGHKTPHANLLCHLPGEALSFEEPVSENAGQRSGLGPPPKEGYSGKSRAYKCPCQASALSLCS